MRSLTLVDLFVGNPPGGTYKASNVAAFIAPGHRPAIVVVRILGVLAVFGVISLLAHLRGAIEKAGGDERMPQIFWGTGVVAAAAIAVGQVFNEGPGMVAGNVSLAPPVIYLAVDGRVEQKPDGRPLTGISRPASDFSPARPPQC